METLIYRSSIDSSTNEDCKNDYEWIVLFNNFENIKCSKLQYIIPKFYDSHSSTEKSCHTFEDVTFEHIAMNDRSMIKIYNSTTLVYYLTYGENKIIMKTEEDNNRIWFYSNDLHNKRFITKDDLGDDNFNSYSTFGKKVVFKYDNLTAESCDGFETNELFEHYLFYPLTIYYKDRVKIDLLIVFIFEDKANKKLVSKYDIDISVYNEYINSSEIDYFSKIIDEIIFNRTRFVNKIDPGCDNLVTSIFEKKIYPLDDIITSISSTPMVYQPCIATPSINFISSINVDMQYNEINIQINRFTENYLIEALVNVGTAVLNWWRPTENVKIDLVKEEITLLDNTNQLITCDVKTKDVTKTTRVYKFGVLKPSNKQVIIELDLPDDAKIITDTKKSRTDKCKIIKIYDVDNPDNVYNDAHGKFIKDFTYTVGEEIIITDFANGTLVCDKGIHFCYNIDKLHQYNW